MKTLRKLPLFPQASRAQHTELVPHTRPVCCAHSSQSISSIEHPEHYRLIIEPAEIEDHRRLNATAPRERDVIAPVTGQERAHSS